MNKSELIDAMALETGLSKKDSKASLEAYINIVQSQMKKKESVNIIGFGAFSTSERAERQGRVPGTGEAITIKATTVAKFKVGAGLKKLWN